MKAFTGDTLKDLKPGMIVKDLKMGLLFKVLRNSEKGADLEVVKIREGKVCPLGVYFSNMNAETCRMVLIPVG